MRILMIIWLMYSALKSEILKIPPTQLAEQQNNRITKTKRNETKWKKKPFECLPQVIVIEKEFCNIHIHILEIPCLQIVQLWSCDFQPNRIFGAEFILKWIKDLIKRCESFAIYMDCIIVGIVRCTWARWNFWSHRTMERCHLNHWN